MFKTFKRLCYSKFNNQLETIPEKSELISESYEYQSFESINDNPQKSKFKQILKKIINICFQIKLTITKIWKSFMFKKSE